MSHLSKLGWMNKNITCSVALFVVHCLSSIVCLRKYRNCHHHTGFLTHLFQYCLLRRIHASRPLQNVWVVIRWGNACAALTLKGHVLRKKCSGCAAFTTFFFCFSRIRATSWMITYWRVLLKYRSVSPIKVWTHVNKYNLYSISEPPCAN